MTKLCSRDGKPCCPDCKPGICFHNSPARPHRAAFASPVTPAAAKGYADPSAENETYGECPKHGRYVKCAPCCTPAAATIPEGMVPWHGGDNAPGDWDPTRDVLCRNGLRLKAKDGEPFWDHNLGHGDIIAYTPKSPIPPATIPGGEREGVVEFRNRVVRLLHDMYDECTHSDVEALAYQRAEKEVRALMLDATPAAASIPEREVERLAEIACLAAFETLGPELSARRNPTYWQGIAEEARQGHRRSVRAILAALTSTGEPSDEVLADAGDCPFCAAVYPDHVRCIKSGDKVHPYRVRCSLCGGSTANHGDFKAAWKAWTRRSKLSANPVPVDAGGVAQSAAMALMYLETGFVECERCGNEVKTDTLDATYELRQALAHTAPVAGSSDNG